MPYSLSRPSRDLTTLLLLLLLLRLRLSFAQQVGSFFTAIYLNGAPVASYQSSCSNMGQGQYCCGAGQSCEWDDTGHVACCPSGSNCQGSPYSSGATDGAYAQSSWQPSTSTYQVTPITTTVYKQGQTNCDCESTQATLVTSYYSVPTSTYYPSPPGTTTTTVPVAQGQGQVTTVIAAPGGEGVSTTGPVACATVSTLIYANVGQPVKTVGCFVIFNEGSKGRDVENVMILMLMGFLGVLGALLY